MLTKGALWTAFVRDSLGRASPADLFFARHDGQRVYRGEGGPWLLSKLTPGMQDQCRTMCFLLEDLKVSGQTSVFKTCASLSLHVAFRFRTDIEKLCDFNV